MKALTEYSWPGNVRELENALERIVVTVQHEVIDVADLPIEIRGFDAVALRPKRERRRTVADDLYKRLIDQRESFWTTVYSAVHGTGNHADQRSRGGPPRPRGGSRQLQDRGPAVQHGTARLQAIPQLLEKA
jgi:DNA-binding NtrC family response regulator